MKLEDLCLKLIKKRCQEKMSGLIGDYREAGELGEGKNECFNLRGQKKSDHFGMSAHPSVPPAESGCSAHHRISPHGVSLVNARGCVVLQSGILLRKAGIAGAPPPPGRALAHGSIPGALPAFPLTTNPSPAFPGERLRSLRGFIRAH